ncbi:hypothetical protein F4W09_01965 [Acinetobacter tandoii]|uniref:Phage abortive infection protein n=1 Tax=Acinetobacter tandoii TaxID=202954 RepID=A0A5N4WVZ2_9GAMM|nr:hypothetical protein [Acinetobacter tandoii]KAB1859913.1 hypothetical protein F4W09_01965 [Acinetobacter tandoii]
MLNILIVNSTIAFVISFIVFKLIIPNVPENYKKKANENFDSFIFAIIIMGGIFLFLFLPLVFKSLAVNVWGIPLSIVDEKGTSIPLKLSDLGPLGDIYGSLNTLFTSITLGIVAYTAGLQRKANEQTFNATEAQLDLAQNNHEEQLKESRNAIFTNQFYALLNFKNERLNKLILRPKDEPIIQGFEIFDKFNREVYAIFTQYKNKQHELTSEKVREEFKKISKKYNNDLISYDIFSYLELYAALVNLLQLTPMERKVKQFYKEMICSSMTPTEQYVLFFLAPMWKRVIIPLKGSYIFNTFELDEFNKEFAKLHYDKTYFAHKFNRERFDSK